MESYRKAVSDIERERENLLEKIDLVQPSFEEQHQLEVRNTDFPATPNFKFDTPTERSKHYYFLSHTHSVAIYLTPVWLVRPRATEIRSVQHRKKLLPGKIRY